MATRGSSFRAEIGGDLSVEDTDNYEDIETPVVPNAGPLDAYKVHHHRGMYSTNENWLQTTTPAIGIIGTGDTNTYGHSAAACLDRLHQAGTKTYWTERGRGGSSTAGLDKIGKNIIVEVAPGTSSYTVQYSNGTDTYALKNAASVPPPGSNVRMEHASWRETVPLQRLRIRQQPQTLHSDCPAHH